MAVYEPRQREIELRDVTITERLFEGLEARGAEVAIVDGTTGFELTGHGLIERIKRFAGGLTAAGLAPGRTIALLAPNIPLMPVNLCMS